MAHLITDEAGPGSTSIAQSTRSGKCGQDLCADDKHVEWIWAPESLPELRELGRLQRASGVLAQFGMTTEEDTVPTSKQAKLVSKLVSERRANQPPKKGER